MALKDSLRSGKIVKRIALVFSLVLFFLLVAGSITYYRWTYSPLPHLDGEVKVSGLKDAATVIRDEWGVPHITAATTEDAIFVQGYVTAQDRLWQMDLLRRAASGELSEVLGESQLEIDKQQRSIGLHRLAASSFQVLPAEVKQVLEAYARGVNAYIESNRDNLPFEFRLLGYQPKPWRPVDSLSIGKLMHFALSSTWKHDLMRAEVYQAVNRDVYNMLFDGRTKFDRPIYGHDQVDESKKEERQAVYISPEIFANVYNHPVDIPELFLTSNTSMIGSNNWAISPEHTTTGKPILAGDPHQGLTLPAIWHQAHIQATDGSFHASGATLVGAPCVVMGHNEKIAWAMTNFMDDVQDLYVEEFSSKAPKLYRVDSEWREAQVFSEAIMVRESMLSSKTKAVEHQVVITRHGPIIATSSNGQKIALKWTGFLSNESELPTIFNIDRAKDWNDFVAALKICPGPGQNFVYADVDGNIGYYAVARIPIRNSSDGALPFDGKTEEGTWTGFVAFEDLPHLFNPPEGFVLSANQRITGKSYPYYISSDWAPPYRAWRIDSLLRKEKKFSPEDIQKMQGDVHSIQYQNFAERILEIVSRHRDTPDWDQWKELEQEFSGWDGQLTSDTRHGAVISTFHTIFLDRFLVSWLGRVRPVYDWYLRGLVIDRIVTERPAQWLPKEYKSYDEMVLDCYHKTIDKLTTELGSDRNSWRYGAVNKLVFAHPLAKSKILEKVLNAPTIEPGGSVNSINAIYTNTERVWGPSMRMVVSMADFDSMTQSIVPGVSGQMASKHYTDQIEDWVKTKPHTFAFSQGKVSMAAKHTLKLQPSL